MTGNDAAGLLSDIIDRLGIAENASLDLVELLENIGDNEIPKAHMEVLELYRSADLVHARKEIQQRLEYERQLAEWYEEIELEASREHEDPDPNDVIGGVDHDGQSTQHGISIDNDTGLELYMKVQMARRLEQEADERALESLVRKLHAAGIPQREIARLIHKDRAWIRKILKNPHQK